MIVRHIFIVSLIITALTLHGQSCFHNNLSNSISLKTNIKRIEKGFNDSCFITVTLLYKETGKIIQTIQITSDFLLDDSAFINCNNVRSYTTGFNKNLQVFDWDYGDIIVVDFNFDNREDLAIKKEVGGNGGPNYLYYFQTEDSIFIYDKFLNENLNCFPCFFDKNKKTIKSICRNNSVSDFETVFKYDDSINKWSVISKREIN